MTLIRFANDDSQSIFIVAEHITSFEPGLPIMRDGVSYSVTIVNSGADFNSVIGSVEDVVATYSLATRGNR